MRYKVKRAFTDRLTGRVYKQGSWYSCDEQRYNEIKHLLIKEEPKKIEKKEPPIEAPSSDEESE